MVENFFAGHSGRVKMKNLFMVLRVEAGLLPPFIGGGALTQAPKFKRVQTEDESKCQTFTLTSNGF